MRTPIAETLAAGSTAPGFPVLPSPMVAVSRWITWALRCVWDQQFQAMWKDLLARICVGNGRKAAVLILPTRWQLACRQSRNGRPRTLASRAKHCRPDFQEASRMGGRANRLVVAQAGRQQRPEPSTLARLSVGKFCPCPGSDDRTAPIAPLIIDRHDGRNSPTIEGSIPERRRSRAMCPLGQSPTENLRSANLNSTCLKRHPKSNPGVHRSCPLPRDRKTSTLRWISHFIVTRYGKIVPAIQEHATPGANSEGDTVFFAVWACPEFGGMFSIVRNSRRRVQHQRVDFSPIAPVARVFSAQRAWPAGQLKHLILRANPYRFTRDASASSAHPPTQQFTSRPCSNRLWSRKRWFAGQTEGLILQTCRYRH